MGWEARTAKGVAVDRYVNFDLVIDRENDGYVARVIDSPAGEATGTFAFPFSKLELENFLLRVGQSRRSVRRIDSPQMEAARQFGGKLYDTVFNGEIRTCFRRAMDEADRHDQGLRIRVRFDDALDMADLPWEYLYSSGLGRFLVLSSQTPLVRYIDLPTRIRPLEVAPPLRILVMVSSPTDYLDLDVENEYRRLEEALDDLVQTGRVELDRLDEASLSKLQQRLRQETYHIFHYVGHGGFDEARDDGVLMLEDEQGRGRAVSGHELGTLLHDHRSLRLAVLNSCEGARNSASDPFAGTAQSLVQQGIPAVIAMQFEISDDAAILFAHEFYAAVADGYPVDAATAEARKAMFTNNPDVEWGTPVLNMRSADGMVFDVQGDPVPRPVEPEPEPEQPGQESDTGDDSAGEADVSEAAPEPTPEPAGDLVGTGDVVRAQVAPPQPPPVVEPMAEPVQAGTHGFASVAPEITEPIREISPTPPKKKVPTWVWVLGAIFGTIFVVGVIGALLPDTTVPTVPSLANTVPGPTVTEDSVTPTTGAFVFRPGPEAHAERLSGFDPNGWPTWETIPSDFQFTPHVAFSDQWDGIVDHGTAWRFGYDDVNFYARVAVTDDVYFQDRTGNQIFLGDSLNLDFDGDLAGDADTQAPNGDDRQVLVSIGSDVAPGGVAMFEGNGSIFVDVPFQTASAFQFFDFSNEVEIAYTVDIAIPWADLGVDPARGTEIGFRVSANDNDLGFALQEVMYTNAADSSLFDTTTWGTLVLD